MLINLDRVLFSKIKGNNIEPRKHYPQWILDFSLCKCKPVKTLMTIVYIGRMKVMTWEVNIRALEFKVVFLYGISYG